MSFVERVRKMEDEPIVNSSQQQINEVKENGKKMRHLGHDYSYKSLPTQKQKKFYNVSAQLGMALNTKILKNYKNVMAATKL